MLFSTPHGHRRKNTARGTVRQSDERAVRTSPQGIDNAGTPTGSRSGCVETCCGHNFLFPDLPFLCSIFRGCYRTPREDSVHRTIVLVASTVALAAAGSAAADSPKLKGAYGFT